MRGPSFLVLAALGLALGCGGATSAAAQQAVTGGAQPAARGDTQPAPSAGDTQASLPEAVPRALASNGAIIAMPKIDALSCPEMAEVLRLIDQSGYRGPEPVPPQHPDYRIFEYENRLSAAYYYSCILAGQLLKDPTPAFAQGFRQP